jgi:hypothetical protein
MKDRRRLWGATMKIVVMTLLVYFILTISVAAQQEFVYGDPRQRDSTQFVAGK